MIHNHVQQMVPVKNEKKSRNLIAVQLLEILIDFLIYKGYPFKTAISAALFTWPLTGLTRNFALTFPGKCLFVVILGMILLMASQQKTHKIPYC